MGAENISAFDQLEMGSKAIVAGVYLATDQEGQQRQEADLGELESLLTTLGVDSVCRVSQVRRSFDSKYLIGSGKLDEMRMLADLHNAEMVVFDHSLNPPQVRNIEKVLRRRVFDRTGIILEIFSRHARTARSKAQVEIARLEYLLPRLTGAWGHFQRQAGGGVKARGMGEQQIEIDRRRARERITRLQSKLQQLSKEEKTRAKKRANEWRITLVGYTNSGKTTLMHGLTRTANAGEDELFATLETQTKMVSPSTRPRILLSDTVGFIRNLPHGLVDSFRSTLEEVVESDLLVHVVDVSHEDYRQQIETTEQVLSEIGAQDVPKIFVFNKLDQLEDPMLPRILREAYKGAVVISGLDEDQLLLLRQRLFDFVSGCMEHSWLRVAIDDQKNQSTVHKHCIVLDSDYSDPQWVYFKVSVSNSMLQRLKQFVCDEPQQRLQEAEPQGD